MTDHSRISRGEAIKALAAAGGALTAGAFLPARWTRPLVESGVLPAHAQASCLYVLSYNPEPGLCCPIDADTFVKFTWTPAGTPDNFSLYYGGVPAQVSVASPPVIGQNSGVIYFSPGQGSSGDLVELTLYWGNCSAYMQVQYDIR